MSTFVVKVRATATKTDVSFYIESLRLLLGVGFLSAFFVCLSVCLFSA